MLDQDNNFYLISLNILISCLQDNIRTLSGEISCWSLLGVKGLEIEELGSRASPYKFTIIIIFIMIICYHLVIAWMSVNHYIRKSSFSPQKGYS